MKSLVCTARWRQQQGHTQPPAGTVHGMAWHGLHHASYASPGGGVPSMLYLEIAAQRKRPEQSKQDLGPCMWQRSAADIQQQVADMQDQAHHVRWHHVFMIADSSQRFMSGWLASMLSHLP